MAIVSVRVLVLLSASASFPVRVLMLPSTSARSLAGVLVRVWLRVLKPQHLYGIWFVLTPYRLPLDTLSEYPEP